MNLIPALRSAHEFRSVQQPGVVKQIPVFLIDSALRQRNVRVVPLRARHPVQRRCYTIIDVVGELLQQLQRCEHQFHILIPFSQYNQRRVTSPDHSGHAWIRNQYSHGMPPFNLTIRIECCY